MPSAAKPSSSSFSLTLSREATSWVRHFALQEGVAAEDVIRRLVDERLFLFRMPMRAVLDLHAAPTPVSTTAADLSGPPSIPPESPHDRPTIRNVIVPPMPTPAAFKK
jgi:hypothetical protein